jgi:hypothetical protein
MPWVIAYHWALIPSMKAFCAMPIVRPPPTNVAKYVIVNGSSPRFFPASVNST